MSLFLAEHPSYVLKNILPEECSHFNVSHSFLSAEMGSQHFYLNIPKWIACPIRNLSKFGITFWAEDKSYVLNTFLTTIAIMRSQIHFFFN